MARKIGITYDQKLKVVKLKSMAETLLFIQNHDFADFDALSDYADAASAKTKELTAKIKAAVSRMAEIAVLKTHIINCAKTRDIYTAYRKAGYSRKYYDAHESDIIIHKAAKKAFDDLALKKMPTVKSLQAEYTQLLSEKKAMYADFQMARDEMRSLQTAKANVDRILGEDTHTMERVSEKDGRLTSISDLKNRAAAAFLQRSQDTELYPAGIGAEPQQAETRHFR